MLQRLSNVARRTFVCFSVVAVLGAPVLLGATTPSNYDVFGIDVLQRLVRQSPKSNVFISPVSIGVALAMAADGAAGKTRAALLTGLDVQSAGLSDANAALIASLRSNRDAAVELADALWLRRDCPPRPEYVGLLGKYYQAGAHAVRFGDSSAAATINTWVRTHTFGLIDSIAQRTDRGDFAVLTNALVFEGSWTTPFRHSDTRLHAFTNADGSHRSAPMMFGSGFYQTVDERTFRALRLPYGSGGYAAYFLLPTHGSADELLSDLSAESFDRLARSASSGNLVVGLPRFTTRYSASLKEVLQQMGLGVAFGRDADFSNMTGCSRVRIADVLHKTYLSVDEAGTTAAAATAVVMALRGAVPRPTLQFIVDRPFVLALRDEHTGALLFIGLINDVPPM